MAGKGRGVTGLEKKPVVESGDTITFHYRLAAMGGEEVDNTFNDQPVTLTLGQGDLAENLQHCLMGLPVGERHVFQLEPYQAFGASDPHLVHHVALSEFPAEVPVDVNSMIEFTLPNGTSLSGVIKSKTEKEVEVDFNHPLADYPMEFEVELLEIRKKGTNTS